MSSSGGAPAPPLPAGAATSTAPQQPSSSSSGPSSGAAGTASAATTTAAATATGAAAPPASASASSASKKKSAPAGGGGPKPKKKKTTAAAGGGAGSGGTGGEGGAGTVGGGGGGGSATKSKSGGGGTTSASRKKKPSTTASGGGGASGGSTSHNKSNAASRQALANEAKKAQHELQKHKALLAAQQSDPLWYSMEDVLLPTLHESNAMVGKTSVLPEQVQVVENALRQTGLKMSDLTPQAMACVLEQARRYALELITDAQDYAHASHPTQDSSKADLLLAADLRADHPVAVSTQLPKLNLVAAQINRAPLPPIPGHCYSGILLPPPEHQLTSRMYDIVYSSQVSRRMVQETPHLGRLGGGTSTVPPPSSKSLDAASASAATTDVPPPSKSKSGGEAVGGAAGSSSYGASRGRQIPIKLKDDTRKTATASSSNSATTTATPVAAPPTTTNPALAVAPIGVPTPGTTGEDVTMTDA